MQQSARAAVALTLAEWEIFVRHGELRLAKRRIQSLSSPPTIKQIKRLFSWAPMTGIGDSNDTLVLELLNTWELSVGKCPEHPAELLLLPISAVSEHHVVGDELMLQLEELSESWGIDLKSGRYAESWGEWAREETWKFEASAAEGLLAAFGLKLDLHSIRDDKLPWRDVMQLARGTADNQKVSSSRLEVLLTAVRNINSEIIEYRDDASFLIRANLMWIQIWSAVNQESDSKAPTCSDDLLERANNLAWHPGAHYLPEVFATFRELAAQYPNAFSTELSPAVVGHLLRIAILAKEEEPDRHEFEAVIRALSGKERSLEGASLLCVVLAAIVGPVPSRRLAELILSNPLPEALPTPDEVGS